MPDVSRRSAPRPGRPPRSPLLDAYAQEHGWLDGHGNPRGFARFYVSLLNSERLALRALGDYLRERHQARGAALEAHLKTHYTVENGG